MIKFFEVPLSSQAQVFTMSVNGVEYKFRVIWNSYCESWIMDISALNDTPILLGVPLVTGTDLLGQFMYLDIGAHLIVQTDHDTDSLPTFDNLGKQSHLYFAVNL